MNFVSITDGFSLGSDVNWYAIWGPNDSISMIFYDFGASVIGPSSDVHVVPNYYLFTIKFDPDSKEITKVTEMNPGARLEWTNNILIWDR